MKFLNQTLFSVFALMLLCSVGFSAVQSVSGYIHDIDSVVLEGATVYCINASNDFTNTSTTGGAYTINDLQDGAYTCNATKVIGQARQSVTAVALTVSGDTVKNMTMTTSNYENIYAGTDIAPVTIDAIGSIAVALIALAVVIGIVVLWKFSKGKKILKL